MMLFKILGILFTSEWAILTLLAVCFLPMLFKNY